VAQQDRQQGDDRAQEQRHNDPNDHHCLGQV
jgi:hypothetical protein